MSRAAVDDILDRIRQLPEEDRRLLDELLAQKEDQVWREEATEVRKVAQSQGIDQAAADRGVDMRRRRLTRYATWTQEDLEEFNEALAAQRTIDDPLWR